MKALLCKEVGDVENLKLETISLPVVGKGMVRIKVHACGVNFPDILMVQGKYQVSPDLPFVPGGEVAGIVIDVGEGVDNVQLGQRVMATIFWGGMAEEAVTKAETVVSIPEDMDFLTASVFQGGHTTVYYALKQRGQLQRGETLLVLGAAGGVGSAAVQLGKAMGAKVIAAVSSREKAQSALDNGADEVVNYSQDNLKDKVKELTDGRGVDVVLDPVGGDQFDLAVRAVSFNSRILVVGFASGRIPTYATNLSLLKGSSLIGVNYMAFFGLDRVAVEENFVELMAMAAEGKIKPQVDKVFPLEDGAKALAYVGDRKAKGKVVVTVVDS